MGGGLLIGCVPPIDGVEATDGATEGTSDDAGPLTTNGPATDSLSGTGVTPPGTGTDGTDGTDGTTSIGVDESGISTNGDDPNPSTTDPGDTSTSDGADSDDSSDTGGTSAPGTTTDATDSSDTDDTSDVMCEEMDNISCDALADAPSIFNAIGLGCEGDPSETIPIGPLTFPPATDPQSYGIATQFGTHLDAMAAPTWGPREGESFLVLSSGTGIEPDEEGVLSFSFPEPEGPNDNPDFSPLPAPIDWSTPPTPVFPGGLPGPTVNDLVWFQVDIEVPPGVTGFSLDMAFFSDEFPENVGTTFNDGLAVWVENGAASYEACANFDGEVTCTVTGLWARAVSRQRSGARGDWVHQRWWNRMAHDPRTPSSRAKPCN